MVMDATRLAMVTTLYCIQSTVYCIVYRCQIIIKNERNIPDRPKYSEIDRILVKFKNRVNMLLSE